MQLHSIRQPVLVCKCVAFCTLYICAGQCIYTNLKSYLQQYVFYRAISSEKILYAKSCICIVGQHCCFSSGIQGRLSHDCSSWWAMPWYSTTLLAVCAGPLRTRDCNPSEGRHFTLSTAENSSTFYTARHCNSQCPASSSTDTPTTTSTALARGLSYRTARYCTYIVHTVYA